MVFWSLTRQSVNMGRTGKKHKVKDSGWRDGETPAADFGFLEALADP